MIQFIYPREQLINPCEQQIFRWQTRKLQLCFGDLMRTIGITIKNILMALRQKFWATYGSAHAPSRGISWWAKWRGRTAWERICTTGWYGKNRRAQQDVQNSTCVLGSDRAQLSKTQDSEILIFQAILLDFSRSWYGSIIWEANKSMMQCTEWTFALRSAVCNFAKHQALRILSPNAASRTKV